jgi:hypothetical protein
MSRGRSHRGGHDTTNLLTSNQGLEQAANNG